MENIKDNGDLIWDKVKENNNFKMELDSKDFINKIKKKEKENSFGLMVILILVNLGIIKDKEKGLWNFMTVDNIKAIGLMIKCMDMGNSHGLMEKAMKVSILMTKNKVKADSIMEMDLFMKDSG